MQTLASAQPSTLSASCPCCVTQPDAHRSVRTSAEKVEASSPTVSPCDSSLAALNGVSALATAAPCTTLRTRCRVWGHGNYAHARPSTPLVDFAQLRPCTHNPERDACSHLCLPSGWMHTSTHTRAHAHARTHARMRTQANTHTPTPTPTPKPTPTRTPTSMHSLKLLHCRISWQNQGHA